MEGEPWEAFALPSRGVGIGLEVLFPAKFRFEDGACRHAPVFLQKNSSSCLEAGEVTEMIVDLGGGNLGRRLQRRPSGRLGLIRKGMDFCL